MRYVIALLFIVTSVQAQNLQPTGTHSWRDTIANRNVHAMGSPTPINYYENGEWDRIVSHWVQVNDTIWKVERGNHKVYAMENGQAYYVRPHGGVRHALGTETVRLIKFNTTDSTWTTLFTPTIDSVTIQQGVDELDPSSLIYHDIFPGVDKTLIYSRGRYHERYTFHQEARDTLTNHMPWADYWLGTATLLDTDSLNLTLHDSIGQFVPGVAGRIISGWVKFQKSGQTVFALSREHLWNTDGASEVVVHKRVVIIGGQPYLVELFDPVPTNTWADGDIWHDAGFGSETEGSSDYSLEGQFNSLLGIAPTSGTGDSIKSYLYCNLADKTIRFALYTWAASGSIDLIDSTEHGTALAAGGTAWYYLEFINAPSITASTRYAIAANGQSGSGGLMIKRDVTVTSDSLANGPGLDISNVWADPITPDSRIDSRNGGAYCYYTEGGAATKVMVLK
jgi:hypothetical protein